AAEPTLGTLERARPGFAEELEPAVDAGLVGVERGTVRFSHPLMAQAVLGLAPAADMRRAHAALATASPSPDARVRGATLDAAALYLDADRMTPANLADHRLKRARLAAECLFIDLSEMVQA